MCAICARCSGCRPWQRLRAANKTTAFTARRAWPVPGIGMYHSSYTAVVSAPSAPT
ncbi:amino acid transporter [Xanthomonas oryzae]|nr:amino acid transporter [Xanthomonas oryzae]